MASRSRWSTDFGRRPTRHGGLTPLGVNAEFVVDAAEAFCERAGHRGGNTARMPVESEDAAERPEPERIGQAPRPHLRNTVRNDVGRDLPGEASLEREEPRRRPAWIQRKVGEPRYDEACKELRIFEADVTERTLRASGSNPKFRMT